MDLRIESTLKLFVSTKEDIFPQGSVYLSYKQDDEFSPPQGIMSRISFGRILYEFAGKIKQSSALILKYSRVNNFMEYNCHYSAFQNEIFFYSKVLPFLTKFVTLKVDEMFPKFHTSHFQTEIDKEFCVMILENLQNVNYVHAPTEMFSDYDHLTLMMRKLGRFHAYSYKAKKVNRRQFFSLAISFMPTHSKIFLYSWNKLRYASELILRQVHADSRYRDRTTNFENLIENLEAITTENLLLSEGRDDDIFVLCHGDFGSHNVLFRYGDDGVPIDAKILDMGQCRYCHPAFDIMYVLYFNANQEVRDQHWEDLIDHYYEALQTTFEDNDVPSRNAIVEGFSKNYIFAILFSLRVLPFVKGLHRAKQNPREISLEMAEAFIDPFDIAEIGVDIVKDVIDRQF